MNAPERQPKPGEAAEAERKVRQDLLGNFISFGHLVALQSLFLGVESIEVRRGHGSREYKAHVQDWYTRLWLTKPLRFGHERKRMLLGSRQIRLNLVGKDFSTGVVDSRGGNKLLRSFISIDRYQIYSCLGRWFYYRCIDETLLFACHSYAGIFHVNSICTARAGRRKSNEII
jgi:hypothetical protein